MCLIYIFYDLATNPTMKVRDILCHEFIEVGLGLGKRC